MNTKRPVSITLVACLYILIGVAGFVFHFKELVTRQPDAVMIELTEIIGFVCGVFMLRGQNWARWLALAWAVFHVAVSLFHPLGELAVHLLLCVVIAWVLFRPEGGRFFQRAGATP
jgi:hypothetical protein